MSRSYKVGVVPGEGIGPEVVGEAVRVLEAVAPRRGVAFELERFEASADLFRRTGVTLPESVYKACGDADAILLGAVGRPDVPDHVSLWGLLIPMRRGFHQYVNLRPVKLLAGMEQAAAKAARGASAGIDDMTASMVKGAAAGTAAERGRPRPPPGRAGPGWRGPGSGGCATGSETECG